MSSWVSTKGQPGFSTQNLPYGIFSTHQDSSHRIGVAIESHVLDLRLLARKQVFRSLQIDAGVLEEQTLNRYAGLGRQVHSEIRKFLQEILSSNTSLGHVLRDNEELRTTALVPMESVQMHLPMLIGDYSDFFTSPYHAQNCTEIVRPGTTLPDNFWRMPLGYHGRASSIVVSGTSVSRPQGQFLRDGSPVFGSCEKLDYEVEFAAFVGKGNEMGDAIPVDEASDHIFGYVLLNDWSARDIQRAEGGLMGPLNGKNFATSISPWIVPFEALEPYRTKPLLKEKPLPYLDAKEKESVHDIPIDSFLKVGSEEHHLGHCNTKNVLFSFSQMLAHHTAGGCPMKPGDLIASGTLSGPNQRELGCLLELSRDGTSPFEAQSAGGRISRSWLQDGDGLSFRIGRGKDGEVFPISFGACEGVIMPRK